MRGFRTLFLFLIIGVLAPIICNDKPLLLIRDQHISFPFLNKVDYNESVKDWTLNALIPFSPGKSDFTNADYKSPFSTQTLKNNSLYYRHWLGTTLRGADVLAGIVEGARYSIIVAFSAALLSLLIGVIMGALSSFSSRHPFQFSILQIIILLWMSLFIYNLMKIGRAHV